MYSRKMPYTSRLIDEIGESAFTFPENNVDNEQLLLSTADEALNISEKSGRNKSSIK